MSIDDFLSILKLGGLGGANPVLNDTDRISFLNLLNQVLSRYDWYCHAYCLMDNYYHLLIETGTPTLLKGMKFLNGSYMQSFNRLHHRVGHVLLGCFKAFWSINKVTSWN